jgi:FkbM family methyltransferase
MSNIKNYFKKGLGKLQKKVTGYETDVLTFSQAGEDIVVRNLFYERLSSGQPGFFVDVGAFHPYKHSNTYYLYKCGWRGINIEPTPGRIDLFNKVRPLDINLEVAVAGEEGELDFYFFGEDSTLNTTALDYTKKLETEDKIKKIIKVPTKQLKTILSENIGDDRAIDFLSIDIEGFEETALNSNDWEKYRPKVIAVEIYAFSNEDLLNSEVAGLLIDKDYEFFSRNILSVPKVNTAFFIDSRQKNLVWQK